MVEIHTNNDGRFASLHGIAGYIDVETTGLNPAEDEIIELALYLFAFHRETGEIKCIVDEYVGLREPKHPITRSAFLVHGIRTKDVAGQALDGPRVREMLRQAEFLVAHNASFDRGFVTQLFPESLEKPWLCSMRGINWRAKGIPRVSLQFLLQAHHIAVEKAHRAGDDVRGAIKLLAKTYQGKTYFAELLERAPNNLEQQASG